MADVLSNLSVAKSRKKKLISSMNTISEDTHSISAFSYSTVNPAESIGTCGNIYSLQENSYAKIVRADAKNIKAMAKSCVALDDTAKAGAKGVQVAYG